MDSAGHPAHAFDRVLAGQANEVYAVTTARERDLILRISRRADPRFEVEAAVIERARRLGIPAPEVLAVGHLEEDDGATAYIIQRKIPGVMLREIILTAPAEVTPILEQLGEVLAGLHEIAVTGFGNLAADLSAPDRICTTWFLDAFIDRHLPQTLAAIEGDVATTDAVHRAIDELARNRSILDEAEPRLAHGDVSSTNVLVDDGKITGLVDWEGVKGALQANDFAWWTSGTTSLAEPPAPDAVIDGYQRLRSLGENFWTELRLSQLRILMGLIGYAAQVDDTSLITRTSSRLRDCVGR
jgi:aminoglycoside phosphotransferase (APT) family kinase protein